jgi:hypothetical protein
VGEVALVDPTYSTAGHVNVGSYDQVAAASNTGNYSYDSVTSLANNLVTAAVTAPVTTVEVQGGSSNGNEITAAPVIIGGVNGKYFFSGLVSYSGQLNSGGGQFGLSLVEYYWGTPIAE